MVVVDEDELLLEVVTVAVRDTDDDKVTEVVAVEDREGVGDLDRVIDTVCVNVGDAVAVDDAVIVAETVAVLETVRVTLTDDVLLDVMDAVALEVGLREGVGVLDTGGKAETLVGEFRSEVLPSPSWPY